jgi:hypothetical protein
MGFKAISIQFNYLKYLIVINNKFIAQPSMTLVTLYNKTHKIFDIHKNIKKRRNINI